MVLQPVFFNLFLSAAHAAIANLFLPNAKAKLQSLAIAPKTGLQKTG
jgi:hypothetical protein